MLRASADCRTSLSKAKAPLSRSRSSFSTATNKEIVVSEGSVRRASGMMEAVEAEALAQPSVAC